MTTTYTEWETVIGLEVHVQLATKTKIFSGSPTSYGAEPNTQANEIDLALPGTLPVPNEQAFRYAIMFGLAINADINKRSIFERKNYIFMAIGAGLIALGFLLMSGGGSNDPALFNPEIYNWRRIRLAPALILIGFGVEVYAILLDTRKKK